MSVLMPGSIYHYRQKAFREHGAGVFDRSFGSYSDNYAEGELGLSLTAVRVRAVMAFAPGYKRIPDWRAAAYGSLLC